MRGARRGVVDTFVAPELASALGANRMVISRIIARDGNGYSAGRKPRGIKEWRRPVGLMTPITQTTHTRLKAAAGKLDMSMTSLVRTLVHHALPTIEKAAVKAEARAAKMRAKLPEVAQLKRPDTITVGGVVYRAVKN